VAGLVGVEPHVLRYWEREFRSIRPTKSAKGQRVYSRKDVENLIRVRELLYRDGFTIAGATKKLQRRSDEPEPSTTTTATTTEREPEHAPPPPEAVAKPKPAEVPRTREKLLALRAEVEAFLEELSPRTR
jgi:DNA-binding transcriptional MerR regulator